MAALVVDASATYVVVAVVDDGDGDDDDDVVTTESVEAVVPSDLLVDPCEAMAVD